MPTTTYDVKTGAEAVWVTVQTAIGTLTIWGLSYTDMDIVGIGVLATAAASVARPVLGYLLSFLPERGNRAGG